jgi:two-component system CheB/CheR fusion protein
MEQSLQPAQDGIMRSSQQFPVVGIGASAGGLEALIAFFGNMPDDTGAAFVVVMHLSPVHESNADAILQRATSMPVVAVTKPVHIEQNSVYVISPNKYLEMNDGYLRVKDRKPGSSPVAIDQFMRTLALAHGEQATAIILSGTGVDGISSLSLIKDQGGIILVQSPEEAGHSGMPRAAIDTGLADFVLPVADMPRKLADLWHNAGQIHLALPANAADVDADTKAAPARQKEEEILRDILGTLRTKSGHDFTKYKQATVLRRIERRLQVRELRDLAAYRDLLRQEPGENQALLSDMLIGVTQFFRDREAFDVIEQHVIPQLFSERQDGDMVRVWSVACSNGQETYSLAMLLAEHTEKMNMGHDFQLFGSDIDERAIAQARAGLYPPSIADDVGDMRLNQHFSK